MRFQIIGLILLASASVPAIAQREEPVDRRIQRLEQEMRAVQRRVFPGGRAQFVEPEIQAERNVVVQPGVPGDAISNLTSRVDALEAQLRSLTGQIEEQQFRTRQVEDQLSRLRTDLEGRIDRLGQLPESSAPAAAQPPEQAPEQAPEEAPAPAAGDEEPAAPAPAADAAQEAYEAGFRLWDSRRYGEAQTALAAAATRYPNSRWASWARNLEGRAYLDDDKPATAARVFLANYQENPRGERAADSLYFLGIALTRLNRRPEACRVYGELEQVYPNMRDFIRERLPQARADARCEGAASR